MSKLKSTYPDGINSFIFEKPPDNELPTCFVIVLKASESFYEKYYINEDIDPNNKDFKNLLKIKSFQSKFNERIEERTCELKMIKQTQPKCQEEWKKKYGTTKQKDIIEKEKEGFFKEILMDYKDKKFLALVEKAKKNILEFKIIQSLDDFQGIQKEGEVKREGEVKKDEEVKKEGEMKKDGEVKKDENKSKLNYNF